MLLSSGIISIPDLLAKAYLAKTLIAFSKTFVRRSSTYLSKLITSAGSDVIPLVRIFLVSFPDLLAKAYLAKTLTAFGKTFVRRSGTRFGFC